VGGSICSDLEGIDCLIVLGVRIVFVLGLLCRTITKSVDDTWWNLTIRPVHFRHLSFLPHCQIIPPLPNNHTTPPPRKPPPQPTHPPLAENVPTTVAFPPAPSSVSTISPGIPFQFPRHRYLGCPGTGGNCWLQVVQPEFMLLQKSSPMRLFGQGIISHLRFSTRMSGLTVGRGHVVRGVGRVVRRRRTVRTVVVLRERWMVVGCIGCEFGGECAFFVECWGRKRKDRGHVFDFYVSQRELRSIHAKLPIKICMYPYARRYARERPSILSWEEERGVQPPAWAFVVGERGELRQFPCEMRVIWVACMSQENEEMRRGKTNFAEKARVQILMLNKRISYW